MAKQSFHRQISVGRKKFAGFIFERIEQIEPVERSSGSSKNYKRKRFFPCLRKHLVRHLPKVDNVPHGHD